MFIKVSDKPEQFINTDKIETLTFFDNICQIVFLDGRAIKIKESAGRGILQFAESNDSLVDDDAPENFAALDGQPARPGVLARRIPTAAPLTSRLAQFLRDNAPNGAALMDLVMEFEVEENQLSDAIQTLKAEKVITLDDRQIPSRYYHVSNAPGRNAAAEP